MATILRDERGQIVEASDVIGTYFYLADDFGTPTCGGWTSEDTAREAFEASAGREECEPAGDLGEDIEIDSAGYRVVDCAYCGHKVRPGDSVPKADDEGAWEQAADDHAPDCEWVATRAHRLD